MISIPKDRMATKDEILQLMSAVTAFEYRMLTTDWLNNGEPICGPPHIGVFFPVYEPMPTHAFFQVTTQWENSGYRYLWEPYKVMIRELLAEGMTTPYPEPILSSSDGDRLDALNVTLKLMDHSAYVTYQPYIKPKSLDDSRRMRLWPSSKLSCRPFHVKIASRSNRTFPTLSGVEKFVTELNL
jgi:hypothetical protein